MCVYLFLWRKGDFFAHCSQTPLFVLSNTDLTSSLCLFGRLSTETLQTTWAQMCSLITRQSDGARAEFSLNWVSPSWACWGANWQQIQSTAATLALKQLQAASACPHFDSSLDSVSVHDTHLQLCHSVIWQEIIQTHQCLFLLTINKPATCWCDSQCSLLCLWLVASHWRHV